MRLNGLINSEKFWVVQKIPKGTATPHGYRKIPYGGGVVLACMSLGFGLHPWLGCGTLLSTHGTVGSCCGR